MTICFVQEMIDFTALLFSWIAAIFLISVYPPLWIIPATAFLYHYLFSMRVSDSCFGYCVHPCRWDQWVHGKNESKPFGRI